MKVVQGDTTMTSKTLVVFYDQNNAPPPPPPAKGAKTGPIQSATPGPGGSSSIRRLEARGGVIVTQKDHVVTGETAIFDTKANQVTMQGGVVLSMDPKVGDFEKADVLIEGKKIAAVGPNLAASARSAIVVNATDRIVMPGFIDTHHHQYETLLRSILAD